MEQGGPRVEHMSVKESKAARSPARRDLDGQGKIDAANLAPTRDPEGCSRIACQEMALCGSDGAVAESHGTALLRCLLHTRAARALSSAQKKTKSTGSMK